MIDVTKLLKKIGSSKPEVFGPLIEKEAKSFSDEALLFFLANACAETGNFSTMRESLYYSSPERLKSVFPSVFVKLGYNPSNYIKNSQKLANLVYDSRINPNVKTLGNVFDGDGFAYRGGGLLQTTGRYNFKKLSEISKIDFIKNPELITEPEYAVKSAVAYFKSNKLHEKKTLKEVRKGVAGSLFGLEVAQDYYNKLKKYL